MEDGTFGTSTASCRSPASLAHAARACKCVQSGRSNCGPTAVPPRSHIVPKRIGPELQTLAARRRLAQRIAGRHRPGFIAREISADPPSILPRCDMGCRAGGNSCRMRMNVQDLQISRTRLQISRTNLYIFRTQCGRAGGRVYWRARTGRPLGRPPRRCRQHPEGPPAARAPSCCGGRLCIGKGSAWSSRARVPGPTRMHFNGGLRRTFNGRLHFDSSPNSIQVDSGQVK